MSAGNGQPKGIGEHLPRPIDPANIRNDADHVRRAMKLYTKLVEVHQKSSAAGPSNPDTATAKDG